MRYNQYRERQFYWGAMTIDAFDILLNANLSSSDYNIFFYLCKELDRNDNFVNHTQKEIGAKLNISKGTVSKSINKLINVQLLVRKRPGFMINPSIFYVGNSKMGERKILRRKFETLVIDSGEKVLFYMDENSQKIENGSQIKVESSQYPVDMPFY